MKKAQKDNEDLKVQVQELQNMICQAEQLQKQTSQVQFMDLFFSFNTLTLPLSKMMKINIAEGRRGKL